MPSQVSAHVFDAVLRGDVETLREWLTSGTRDLNEWFWYSLDKAFGDDVDPEDICACRGALLHCACDQGGMGCLIAAEQDQRAVVSALLVHGADANAVDGDGLTPLHHSSNLDLSAMLLDAGADIDARADVRNNCETPLMSSVHNPDLVRLLVRRGADFSLMDDDGLDAEAYARNPHLLGPRTQITDFRVADFLAGVKAAGSDRKYLNEPRVQLLMLRALCARGRATAPTVIFERLFGAPASPPARPPALPRELFWFVLSFWRTDRDA